MTREDCELVARVALRGMLARQYSEPAEWSTDEFAEKVSWATNWWIERVGDAWSLDLLVRFMGAMNFFEANRLTGENGLLKFTLEEAFADIVERMKWGTWESGMVPPGRQ